MKNRSRGATWVTVLVVVLALLLIAFFLIPFIFSPFHTHRSSVVGLLREIQTAEVTYASDYNHGYSAKLSYLGLGSPTPHAKPSSTAAGLMDPELAGSGNTSLKSGYRFVYTPGPVVKGKIESYSVIASPEKPGVTGTIYYYTDQTGVIRQNTTAPAGASDSPIPTM